MELKGPLSNCMLAVCKVNFQGVCITHMYVGMDYYD